MRASTASSTSCRFHSWGGIQFVFRTVHCQQDQSQTQLTCLAPISRPIAKAAFGPYRKLLLRSSSAFENLATPPYQSCFEKDFRRYWSASLHPGEPPRHLGLTRWAN
jgi:hypothetical protein